jgi:NRAMP (natural resistance-associated macrophage protein)-like metal ion transporter
VKQLNNNALVEEKTRGRPASPIRSRQPGAFQRILRLLGPGFITGASDDDPSGIGTYAVAGASFGFATLWTALITFPLMTAVQFICAKIGMVTGRGLAGTLKRHYPAKILYVAVIALVVANTINAGADIGAIAAAINLLVPVPAWAMVIPISLLIVIVQIWGSYRLLANLFKWLALSLLAYIGSAYFAHPSVREVVRGTLIPTLSLDRKFLSVLVGLFGTTISPYLFFWQANQEVEEEIANGKTTVAARESATKAELSYAAWDVNIGMFFSNLVMYFIILSTAATLFKAGKTDIQSATDAALALQPLAGRFATALLALGLIGSGMLAVPILTGSSAYAVAETFGWKCGLGQKPHRAKRFYLLIAVSTLVGMCINFTRINPIAALFWTAVLNGFLAAPLLVLVMMISANRKIMGDRVNGIGLNVLGWITTALMFAAAIALVLTWNQ